LPIVPIKDIDEAIAYVNDNDHPLVLYVFSKDNTFKQKGTITTSSLPTDPLIFVTSSVFKNTQSGAAVANEVVLHPGGMSFFPFSIRDLLN